MGGRVINLHSRQVTLDAAEPLHDFTETRLNAIEPLVNPREIHAEKVEDVRLFGHVTNMHRKTGASDRVRTDDIQIHNLAL